MFPSSGSHAGRRLVRPGCSAMFNGSQRPITSPIYYPCYTSRRSIRILRLIRDIGGVIWYGGATLLGFRKLRAVQAKRVRNLRKTLRNTSLLLAPRSTATLDFSRIDQKWRSQWQTDLSHRGNQVKEKNRHTKKFYILPMFPYPSGELHLGHLRVYTISDTLGRFKHMQGYNVMHPIGWDAFGLPAENAAIERGIDPAKWTSSNIDRMKKQLEAMNGRWNWDREFATCDPGFYKHTQRLFLLLYKHGLAYQSKALVNYDPVDKTVLANEQVDANGNSWRSGAKVEKRMLKQWFFAITKFRDELLSDLRHLAKGSAWPERVLAMQKNWIGKSQGARIKFAVTSYSEQAHPEIEVFTTRPDTLFGVQYIALASNHPIVKGLAENDAELQAFLDTMPALPADSKVGYLLPHIRAINPLAYEPTTPDATKASLPIFVAPYVLGDYGDGAVMGVPGHDTRDHGFWKHNRGDDPIRPVLAASPETSPIAVKNLPFVHEGYLLASSGPYAGLSSKEAARTIVKLLASKGRGSAASNWRLRDWLVSRQRYWGTPIPIIHCQTCGPVPVPEDDLPVELPPVQEHWTKGKTGNPLEHAHEWVNTSCPKCGNEAKRDTDTMDTFVDSSWYFMRFPDAKNEVDLFSSEKADALLPVDIYVGGVEHAILHLLYARFISKFLATTSYWPAGSAHHGEPFKRLLTQGMVHGKTFSDPNSGRFLKPSELNFDSPSKPIITATGQEPRVSYEKMSKSKYNGVDPGTCIRKYGADATRAHILFQAPVTEILEWDEERIAGVTRWLRKLHEFIERFHLLWANVDMAKESSGKSRLLKIQESSEKVREVESAEKRLGLEGKDHGFENPSFMHYRMAVEFLGNYSRKGLEADKKLWRKVQRTIMSVTDSYSNTYSLNTVVSDLMTLTNAIIESANEPAPVPPDFSKDLAGCELPIIDIELLYHATSALIRMMAPIVPAYAEECWQLLNATGMATRSSTHKKIAGLIPGAPLGRSMKLYLLGPNLNKPRDPSRMSVFDHPFPEVDGTLTILGPSRLKCAVQVNGKLRAVVDVPIPKTQVKGEQLSRYMTEKILQTAEGKKLGVTGGKIDIRNAKKVIVVQGGKTVNYVL